VVLPDVARLEARLAADQRLDPRHGSYPYFRVVAIVVSLSSVGAYACARVRALRAFAPARSGFAAAHSSSGFSSLKRAATSCSRSNRAPACLK
jgi:hypothetical protein